MEASAELSDVARVGRVNKMRVGAVYLKYILLKLKVKKNLYQYQYQHVMYGYTDNKNIY